jgi:hypothetical protein
MHTQNWNTSDSLNETLLTAEENPDPSFFAMQTYKDHKNNRFINKPYPNVNCETQRNEISMKKNT